MSYNNRIENNNADLQEILNTINNLPEGGSTGKVATITITSTFEFDASIAKYYTIDKNGNLLTITTEGIYEVNSPVLFCIPNATSGLYIPDLQSGDAIKVDNLNYIWYICGDCIFNIAGESSSGPT